MVQRVYAAAAKVVAWLLRAPVLAALLYLGLA
jgi:hypothetical protein